MLHLIARLIDLRLQKVEHFVTGLNRLKTFLLGLGLDGSDRDAEGSDEWLREAHKDVIIAVTGQTRAVELLNRELDIEGQHRVDVGVGAACIGVGLHIGHSLGLLRRQKGLDCEFDVRLLNRHQTEGLKLAKTKHIDLEIVLLGWHVG